jgi:hypothetical protein
MTINRVRQVHVSGRNKSRIAAIEAGQFKGRLTMSDNGTLFPILPAATLKTYAPMGAKFWESQETALKDLKEFADGWFARRQKGMHAALEAAQHIGGAESPSDMVREYQNWFTREMELLAEDGKACQQQLLRAGAQVRAQQEEQQQVLRATAQKQPEEPETGKRRTG